MKKLTFLAFFIPVLVGTACSEENEPKPETEPIIKTITFDDCEFTGKATNNAVSNKITEYEEFGCKFSGKDYYGMYGGVFVSSKAEKSEWESEYPGTPGALNVIGNNSPETAGADGTTKFAVFSANSYVTDCDPLFAFTDGTVQKIVSAEINNTVQVWQYAKIGYYSRGKFEDGDFCEVIFTGYDADGNETGTASFAIADYRNGKQYLCEEWTTVDLSALGEINKVVLSVNSSQAFKDAWNDNFSVCLDEIKFELPAEE